MRDQAPPQGAQAALRAIRLLKLFTAQVPELRLAEISSLSGLNKTTTHRLLQALHSEELLDRNPGTGAYRLGPGMMALGVQALSSNDLRLRARPLLRKLADETGETATLEVPIEDTMLILDEVTSKHFLGASGNVGTRWPIHATSTGKVLIAFERRGPARLGPELASLTPKTITQFDKLEKELGDIRRRGFAEVVDELEDGLSGVAAVVRGGMGEVLGALSICGPSQRMSENRRAQLGLTLCTVATHLQPRY
ncbi:MAG: helix-turn-helix domain-containing protein [Gammaproteobacteria bacterium]|jgi:DNA-binding IclR family transcriptional regulator|nr:helix-turn-helix domain-containing protein [Gammaproteobacteria bacterium]